MKRFVAGINSMTAEQEEAFLKYLKANNFAYWHWIDNFWLVVDHSGKLTSTKLIDKLKELAPKKILLIMDLMGGGEWHGFGPIDKEKNMFDWLNDIWTKG